MINKSGNSNIFGKIDGHGAVARYGFMWFERLNSYTKSIRSFLKTVKILTFSGSVDRSSRPKVLFDESRIVKRARSMSPQAYFSTGLTRWNDI
ncbi:MAG: hypothetical protein LBJ00_09080 [Planctomycetaceae bacterium]|nr:hypothetical protein [Planctomycetaceae bacterium]